jgi:23S rRNA (guanosine2251-2'-O)-methyltransferase
VERLPYRATAQASVYDDIQVLPVTVLLDNVRSMYNVGAFFRTADGVALERLLLSGITGRPPKKEIAKTALGADEHVPWMPVDAPADHLLALRTQGYEIAAIETSQHSVDLYDWEPRFPVCLIFGHEVDGIQPPLLAACDTHVRLPMLGRKHSLNVATAGGIVLYELLRKYRRQLER